MQGLELDTFHHLGFIARMITNVLLFLFGSTCVVWLIRTLDLRASRRESRGFSNKTALLFDSVDFQKLQDLSRDYHPGYLALYYSELMDKILAINSAHTFPCMKEALPRWSELAICRVMERYRKDIVFLASASATAPLLGALATTTELIQVFRNWSESEEAIAVAHLPWWMVDVVSQVLGLLCFGLLTGLIARWGYLGLQKRCAAIRAELNAEQLDLTNRMLRHHRRIRPLACDERQAIE